MNITPRRDADRRETMTNETKFTPGPWGKVGCAILCDGIDIARVYQPYGVSDETHTANARLIAAAPTQHAELLRYLPVLERAEADPELWARLTAGTGIATLNGYRAALAKATQP
jgi:hypothetical protein